MAKTINRLTATKVTALKKRGMYLDGAGLYLQVSTFGTKSWVFRFKSPTTNKVRDMGLGPLSDVSLADARAAAGECRKALIDGRDPINDREQARIEARLAAARTKTFDECAASYITAHEAGWRNAKHRWQWERTIEAFVSPTIGKRPVADIETSDVVRVLTPIWTAKPETASRVRQRIERILNWATAHGYRRGDNPARWRGHLDNLLPKKSTIQRKQNYPAMPYGEIGAFMVDLRTRPAVAARALEYSILTAARSGEALGARWSEIDFKRKLWTVPAERMKAGQEHRVPLSDAAMKILQPLHKARVSEYVFPGYRKGEPLSQMAMLMLLRRMGHGNITVHGFRSTFRDWTAEHTNFPNHVAEMALAHTVTGVEGDYRRGDLFQKRRKLMEAWAGYCAQPSRKETGEVVALRA